MTAWESVYRLRYGVTPWARSGHERAWYEDWLVRSYDGYMSVLPGVNDADLDVVCTTRNDKKRTVEWVLHQVPGHTNYHVGQINYIHGRYEETVAKTSLTAYPLIRP